MTFKDKLDKFTILIPIFNLEKDGSRLDNFKYILNKVLELRCNILVVEQVLNKDEDTISKQICKNLNVDYHPVEVNDTCIHKSKLINVGTDRIQTEFVWVNDSDCYIKFEKVIRQIDFRFNFIQPYITGKYLNKSQSTKIRNNETVSIDFNYKEFMQKGHIYTGSDTYVAMYGALSFVYRKKAFNDIGKMNEDYKGWGLEDNSLCLRVLNSNTSFSVLDLNAVHLYHPRNTFKRQSDDINTSNNIKTYEKEFNNTFTQNNHDIRELYADFFDNIEKISIIGISRSGTTHLMAGISNNPDIVTYNESFNEYGLIGSETRKDSVNYPIANNLNQNLSLDDYIDLNYRSSSSSCLKYIVNEVDAGSTKFKMSKKDYINTCINGIIEKSTKIVITTRYNFLDWLTSQILASTQNKWTSEFGKYDENITNIDKQTFEKLYDIWHEFHFKYVPKIQRLCERENAEFLAIDYDDISNDKYLREKLNSIGINRFTPKYKKQKIKKNSDYIINYAQVKKWHQNQEKLITPYYIITRFSLKHGIRENHLKAEWLNNRLKLFDTCVESLNNQTCKKFEWLVLIHPDTLDFAKNKLYEYKDKLPQIKILEINSNIWDQIDPYITEYIKQVNNCADDGKFITMWHDSDDLLVDKNCILDFHNHLKDAPINTLAKSSIQTKGFECTISPVSSKTRVFKTTGTGSTCIAIKSTINESSSQTIFKYAHELWADNLKDAQIIEVLPKKMRHYKIIHKDAIVNTPKVDGSCEKTLIIGTGRCGSSCLLQFFNNTGINTKCNNEKINPRCLGGFESGVDGFEKFNIVKNTCDKDFIKKIKNKNINLKNVIIPIRNLSDAAESRRYQTKIYGDINSTRIPAGGVHLNATMSPGSMENKLSEFIYNNLLELSELNIQPILLDFPRFVEDKNYLWDKIRHILSDVKYGEFCEIFDNTFDISKVHTYSEDTLNLITLYNKLPKSDKGTDHAYIQHYYNNIFKGRDIKNLIEIGVQMGRSINLWSKYFGSDTTIYGVDINLNRVDTSIKFDDNVKLIEKNAIDESLTSSLPNNIDVIIDDGSHKLEHQLKAFELLFPSLNDEGIYIIEDIQNIDDTKDSFLSLPGQVKIHDLRGIKNRYDDVIVEITK